MQNNRAFQQMLLPAKERVCLHSPEEIAEKSGVVFQKDRSCFELQSLNQTIQITFPDCTFQPQVQEWHQLVILHYLDLADGAAVSSEMIPFGALKDGLIRGTRFDRDMENALQRFLAGKTKEQLCKSCRGLGAELIEERADLCAVFPFLPHYPLWLKIWLADEEFDASGKLLVSKSADHYLAIEDAVTVGEILLERLKGTLD
ncbi:MAG: DUF3786 domain-containing protein [Lachnospiraceae bacterium]|nr:DUF3786 domain-containing protein [Lachnospiraceae bacterium]